MFRTDLCSEIGDLNEHGGITRRYRNAIRGLNSAYWGSLLHQQMDKPPDDRNPFFRDLVPSMLVCTIYTNMKPFVIELLMGLVPVWEPRRALVEGGRDSSISTQNLGSRARSSARTAGSFRVGWIWASSLRSAPKISTRLSQKRSSTSSRSSSMAKDSPSSCACLW